MATPIYYLADTTKEWNLKLLKLPTNGEYNLFGDTYSYTDDTNKTNLSLGTTISRNITGSYNLSLGPNVCSVLTTGSYNTSVGSSALNKITTMSRNLALGSDSLTNLSILASGLASVTLTAGGVYSYPFTSSTGNFLVTATGPYTTLPIVQYNYVASFSSKSGWTGNIQSVLLTYSGTGFTSSTTFTFTPVVLLPYESSPCSVSYAYNNPNTGNDNLAIGYQSLYSNLTSTLNMAIGNYSLYYLNQTTTVSSATLTNDSINNIAIGYKSQYGSVTGTNNISLGNNSLAGLISSGSAYAPSNIICIGNNALASITTNGSNSIVIGNNSMTASITNAATTQNICIGNTSMTRCNGGYDNVCVGNNSGISITTGFDNVIIGSSALTYSIGTGLTGYFNTFINSTITGNVRTAYRNFISGDGAAKELTTGNDNIIIGYNAAFNNGGGYNNIAIGKNALYLSGNSHDNVAIGINAGYLLNSVSATVNNYNVCIGTSAGKNQSGSQNICIGYNSGNSPIDTATGTTNVCIGSSAGYNLSTGNNNTCLGQFSGQGITTGSQNICIGYYSGYGNSGSLTNSNNVCIGTNSGFNLTTGANNTLIGTVSQSTVTLTTTGSNVTTLGYLAAPSSEGASNQITLGNSSVATLRCQVALTVLSDARDKTDIIDIPIGLDFINKVRPVKFTWAIREKQIDENGDEIINPNNGTEQVGFIAQELDEVQTNENANYANLVLKDNPDKMEATYERLLPVMVKAIQELSAKVESLSQELALLKASK